LSPNHELAVKMIHPRNYAFFGVAALIVVGWLLLAVLDPDPRSKLGEYLGLGYLFGTMFGHTALAGTWLAFGPLPLFIRLPGSVACVAALLCALAINLALHGGPGGVFVTMLCCLLGQWCLVLPPLWGLVYGYGLRLQHHSQASRPAGPRDRQFGIRQVMILTAIVGVVLGIGRIAVPHLAESLSLGGEAPIFIFLAVAGIVMTIPLLLAALLPRMAMAAVIAVLLFMGLATAFELPLLKTVQATTGGPDVGHFIGINVVTAIWILAVAGAMRLGGYSLARQVAGESPFAST
jgi:hypothetical protein